MRRFGFGRELLATALLSALCATSLVHAQAGAVTGLDAARQDFLGQHPGAAFYFEEDGSLSRVYGQAFSHGANAVASADAFLQAHAGVLGSTFGHLLPIGPNGDGAHVLPLGYDAADGSYKFSLVGYTQHINGIPVFRGDVRCLVRNEPGYPLVLVANALKDVTAFAETFTGKAISPSQIDLRKASRLPLNQFGPGATISDQEQVIWAGYEDAVANQPRLAYKFIVTGTGVFDRSLYQRMLYVVDAATNKILFQEDQVLSADIVATVRGNCTVGTAADACSVVTPTVLPYPRVTANGVTYYGNAAGVVTIPNASGAAVTVVSNMLTAGRYFNVNDTAATTESSITQSSTGGALDFLHNAANTDESDRAEVNAYLQANKVRDYLLGYNPAYPTIANQLSFPVNVQVAGTCNAFYNGSSVNFYPAGGGCNNTAFSVVVHHEYGHHIVQTAGSGQGAYGEGYGDVMGVLVTDESILAVGFQTCGAGIRNANNLVQYSASSCSSAGTEVHACGTLLSGCVWSTRTNLAATNPLTYRTLISGLAIDSVLLHSGTGITPQITIDFLTLDDDNGNIGDGTPHYTEINNGFSAHGMPGPAIQLLSFALPDGTPSTAAPAGGTTFRVNVSGVSATPAPGSGRLFYRIGSSGLFSNVVMTQTAANQYVASLPASACGSTLQYYVGANTTTGSSSYSPADAPATFYTAVSASGMSTPFTDTVETNVAGWTLTSAGDTATTGLWVRGDPLGTNNGGVQVQPEDDVTAAPGVNCFFTGQGTAGGALGENDVDGGFTTLTSPAMNASGGEAYVSYYRWYSNMQGGAPGADTFRVQISSDNGASWAALETVGPTTTSANPEVNGGWFLKEFRVADFVTPTSQVRLRFIADDAGTGSLIEAAVDEVRMRVVECSVPIPGDLNFDDRVDAGDLAIMLNNWFGTGVGDINNDGGVDAIDLGILLNNWTG